MLRKIFLIAFLRIVHFESISGISIVKHNNKLHCILSNDTTSAAITWDYGYKATFEYITIDNTQDVWTLKKSEETEFAGVPILDYRWELFDVQNVCHYALPVSSTFEMAISIQGSSIVYLCDTSDIENCYRIGITSAGAFFLSNEQRHQCNNYNKTSKYDEWLHFTLSLRDHIFYVKLGKEYKIDDLENTFSPKYLVIDRKWKVHSFSVYSTLFLGTSKITLKTHLKKNKMLCFGLLVYVSNYSTISVLLENGQKNVVPKNNTKLREWEEIQVCGNALEEATLIITTSSSIHPNIQSDLFYIANIVRTFKQPDIRITTLEEKDETAHYCCYNIKSSTIRCTYELAFYKPPDYQNCPLSSIGANCIPCDIIFNQTYCENVAICDSTRSYSSSCSCPSGYASSGCTDKCAEGYYGFNCQQYCSDCQGSCSHVTGKCSSTNCTSNDCTIGLAPAAVRNVTVYMVTPSKIGIRWLKPYPPTGVVGQYRVEWGIGVSNWERDVYPRTHFCKIWTEYIKALNENASMYGPYTTLAAITRSLFPSEPKNINYFWNETNNALTLKWEHPDIPNGRIIGFIIKCHQHHSKWKYITNESLEYQYEFQYNELNTTSSSNIALAITTVSHVYYSKSHTLTIFTPPKTPKFLHNVSVINTTSNSVRIQVPKLLDIDGESSRLFLLVTDKKPLSNSNFNNEKVIAKRAGISEGQNFWIAVNRPLNVSSLEPDEIDIGSELLENLNPQTTYEIYLLLENQYQDIRRYAVLKLDITTLEGYNYMLLLLLLLLLLVIPVVSGVLIFRSRRKIKMSKANNGAISSSAVPMPENAIEGLYEEPKLENEYEEPQLENEYEKPKLENEYEEVILKTIPNEESYSTPLNHLTIPSTLVKPEVISTNEESHMSAALLETCAVDTLPIELHELKRYVRHCLQNDEFDNQYRRALSKILLDSSKVCECNVQLPNVKSIYINGYDTTKAYIATEAPQSTKNVNYFWKMIWQENVEHIIMIADSTLLSAKSQEKYWPDINKTKYYGDITINCFEVTQCAHYTRTLLILIFEGKPRQIQHLHFTAWCHDALPFYPQNLVTFLKETATIPHKESSIAIHSNRGFGRIATFIICDLCLRSAKEARKLDVYSCLCNLRQQGVGIDNVDQYKLIHLILLHCLVESDNGILCTKDLGKTINYILSSELLPQQMMYVDDNSWQDEAILEMCTKVQLVMEAEKNKTIPDGYTAVVSNPLSLPRKKLPSYIDVIEVDRFRTSSKFIVAKYPAQATLTKFWQFVEECEIGTILCLNELSLKDMDYCKFYPSYEEKMHLESDLEILCTGVMKELHYNLYSIDINDYKCEQKKKTVRILHTNGWKYAMLHPKSPETLLMLRDEMNRLTEANKPILIVCSDGVRGSGLFTSLCYLIEKIKIESICDVCLAVRTVRRNRPEFVKNLEQFSFLYQTAFYDVQHSEINI